jgi:hypothetical protein
MDLQVGSFLFSVVLSDVFMTSFLMVLWNLFEVTTSRRYKLRLCKHVSFVDVKDEIYDSNALCPLDNAKFFLPKKGGSDLCSCFLFVSGDSKWLPSDARG